MADVRIGDLGQIATLQDTDYLVVGSGNNTYKTTVQDLKEAISPSLLYKRITTQGIHYAADDHVYGYSGVNVEIDSVSGIKGDSELNFRDGYVNLTPADIGVETATVSETKAYLGIS